MERRIYRLTDPVQVGQNHALGMTVMLYSVQGYARRFENVLAVAELRLAASCARGKGIKTRAHIQGFFMVLPVLYRTF